MQLSAQHADAPPLQGSVPLGSCRGGINFSLANSFLDCPTKRPVLGPICHLFCARRVFSHVVDSFFVRVALIVRDTILVVPSGREFPNGFFGRLQPGIRFVRLSEDRRLEAVLPVPGRGGGADRPL